MDAPGDTNRSLPQHGSALVALPSIPPEACHCCPKSHQLHDLLENARARIEAASIAKDNFLAAMSHELRTPLTAILGFTEILRSEASLPATASHHIELIHRNAHRLLAQLSDILDLSRAQMGTLSIAARTVQLLPILEGAVDEFTLKARERGLALRLHLLTAIPATIHTDPLRLSQIITNLVANAVKFTEEGAVEIDCRLIAASSPGDTDMLVIRVRDSGIGIEPAGLAAIFEPFSQINSTSSRHHDGTGLGLAIGRQLAQLLGGRLTATSNRGVGSTFCVEIPASSAARTPPSAPTAMIGPGSIRDISLAPPALKPAPNPAPASSPPLTHCDILLAEDGLDNQRLITHFLTKAGAKVTIAENGRLAVDRATARIAAGKPFDIILMDMQMPLVDGYQATRQLREAGLQTPIIAVTAHALPHDRQLCLDAGCNDYVPKPIERATFITLLRHTWHKIRPDLASPTAPTLRAPPSVAAQPQDPIATPSTPVPGDQRPGAALLQPVPRVSAGLP